MKIHGNKRHRAIGIYCNSRHDHLTFRKNKARVSGAGKPATGNSEGYSPTFLVPDALCLMPNEKETHTMKKHLTLVGLLAIAVVFALSATEAAAQKIGFINMRAILHDSEAGKKAQAEMKKVVEKKKAEITKKEEELKKLKDELEKQKSVLTAEAYRDKEASYQVKFRDYQRMVQDANEELAKKEQDMTGKMIPEVLKIVEQVGKEGKYDAILDLNNPIIVYHDKADNLTKKIIEEYNKGAGKSAPAKGKK